MVSGFALGELGSHFNTKYNSLLGELTDIGKQVRNVLCDIQPQVSLHAL